MNIVEVKTIQSSVIRILIEALKEILTDVNIRFDENGITIMEMDSSHTVLASLKLDKDKFDYFHCEQTKIVGITTTSLFGSQSQYNGMKWWKSIGTTAGSMLLKPLREEWSFLLDFKR